LNIGFFEIRLLDIIDIVLVAILLYQVYKLLRGSLAFNIFIGLILIYLITFLTRSLNMRLMYNILRQFIDVGVIALLIVFQPEIRRFLLNIGRRTTFSDVDFGKWFNWRNDKEVTLPNQQVKDSIIGAINSFSDERIGALIVLADPEELSFFQDTGVKIDAEISAKLLQSIFDKTSPLHDGAVVISGGKISRAGCILPVSENQDIPHNVGLRHRAAVGITEEIGVKVLIVSEETGKTSYAKEGKLVHQLPKKSLNNILDVVLVAKEM